MSAQLEFCGKSLPIEAGETVLECLLRHEQPVASSCRSGVCQSCLVQGEGPVPEVAQRGLKPSLVAQGFFLACQCPAEGGLRLTSAESLPVHESRVISKKQLSAQVIQVKVERPAELDFRAGQFLSLIRPGDSLTRSYSVANLPHESSLEFHVALLPGGRMGRYLNETEHAQLLLRGPFGDCFYLEDKPDEPLLLVATGTGLAPVLGVVRAALSSGHRGPIHLFHGARDSSELYLSQELREMDAANHLFNYYENVLAPVDGEGEGRSTENHRGTSEDLFGQVKAHFASLAGFRVYLCGHPDFVRKMKKQCFLAGAKMQSIHSDPFVLATNFSS